MVAAANKPKGKPALTSGKAVNGTKYGMMVNPLANCQSNLSKKRTAQILSSQRKLVFKKQKTQDDQQ